MQDSAPSAATAWPFLGRDAELRRIVASLAAPGPGVAVVAGPGVGKSRLAREVIAEARRSGAMTEWVQATSSAAAVPLGAFAAVLPEGTRSEDPFTLLRRSTAVLKDRADGRPIVLAVDDAQLLDPVSAALVLHLVTHAGVRVLVTVRAGTPCPDAIVALWKDAGAARIELDVLGDDVIRALVEHGLDGPVDETTARWMLERSHGNPLYLRELVASTVDSGALSRQAGLWRLAGSPRLGATLLELLLTRLDALPPEARMPLELLALGEPLQLNELTALTSVDAVAELEAHGLIELDASDQLRVSDALFGEAIRSRMTVLRARMRRIELAEALERRGRLTAADALRVVRLRIDAGAEIPSDLQLTAAEAANLAGDPELGAQLARGALADGGGLPAALLLARAHSLRERHEEAEQVLAAAEPLAAEAGASDYLWQRTWVLLWGLREPVAAAELLDRAASWSADAAWVARVEQARHEVTIVREGFTVAPPDGDTPTLQSLRALGLLARGRGDEAAAVVRELAPPVPLRDPADAAAIGTRAMVSLASGNDWPELEAFAADILRAGVRANDHQAAGSSALALGGLAAVSGRYRDATRWFAEAELHFAQQDLLGNMVHVFCWRVIVAVLTGDLEAVATALARVEAALGGHAPLPTQLPYVLRARAWAARTRSDAEAVELLRDAAEQLTDAAPVFAAQLCHDAVRAGATGMVPRLAALAARGETRLVSAYAAHAGAREAHDGAALLAAAEELAAIGARHAAAEVAAEAAAAFLRAGRQDSARRAAIRTRELVPADQGAPEPPIDGLDSAAVELTRRERQLVDLAARGLSNSEIADRLVISVRTVETHLYRAMQKLGINDRREFRPPAATG